MRRLLFAVALILGTARALDVSIEEVVCDQSLDVTADIQMQCNGGSRCAFGSTSRISGSLKYNGVNYSGIQNNQAYVTFYLKFLTLDFKPLDMKPFQLCSANLESQSECPADGSYSYSIPYKLPSAGAGHPIWLASGFQGKGIIRMYAEQDERMLIGECYLKLKTYVTRTEENTYGPLETPSAAVSLGMALALMTLVGMCCCYSRCCIRRKRNQIDESQSENDALFTRMEDNDKAVLNHQPETIVDLQKLPDTENPSSISTLAELDTPRKQKTLQMPLM